MSMNSDSNFNFNSLLLFYYHANSISFSEFLQCIKRLYNCQEAGISRQACKDVELCLPQPRFDDSLEDELINYPSSEKPVQDDSIEEILGSYLPPKDTSGEDSKPSDSDLGIGGLLPPPNGHGKPVGTFTEDEMARPATTKRPTQRPAGGPTKRPARPTSRPNRPSKPNRPNRPSRPSRPNRPNRPSRPNKRPSSVQHPTQRKTRCTNIDIFVDDTKTICLLFSSMYLGLFWLWG